MQPTITRQKVVGEIPGGYIVFQIISIGCGQAVYGQTYRNYTNGKTALLWESSFDTEASAAAYFEEHFMAVAG